MLAKRVIPCLDVDRGRVVKGVRFADTRDAGDAVALAERYNGDGADELFIPFTVGGGIDSAELAGEILRAGADKVAVNSAAVRDPALVGAIARRYGSQACVLAIDARRAGAGFEVVIDGGRVTSGREAVAWAREGVQRGAGEILLSSIDRDGTRDGFDLELTEAVAAAVDVPVIASGGASSSADFVTLFERTHADAGLAASIFHYDELKVYEVKAALAAAGIAVRPVELAYCVPE